MTDTVPQVSPSSPQRLMLDGPLTVYHAGALTTRLQAALRQADGERLELDLTQVSEIDTAGLQLLLLAQRESQRLQRSLHIVGISEAVREVVNFCRLAAFLNTALAPEDHAAALPQPHSTQTPA